MEHTLINFSDRHADSVPTIPLHYLPSNCDTVANFDKYAGAGQYALYATDALQILYEANLLTTVDAQTIFDRLIEKFIAAEKHHKSVFTALRILKEAGLLTGANAQANFVTFVNASVNAKILFKILRNFHSENFLDQDNYNKINEAGENAWPVAEGLLTLKSGGLLTGGDSKKYRDMVCRAGENARPVAMALLNMKWKGLTGDSTEITEAYDTLVTDWRKSPHVGEHWKESSPQEIAEYWGVVPAVIELVDKHIISLEQALDLDLNQENALAKKEVRYMLSNGELHQDLQKAGNSIAILKTARSRCEIRRCARLLGQGVRSQGFFRCQNIDLLAKIAGFAGSHEEGPASEIAKQHIIFHKPKLKAPTKQTLNPPPRGATAHVTPPPRGAAAHLTPLPLATAHLAP